MIETTTKDGIDCIKFTIDKSEYFINEEELLKIGRGIRLYKFDLTDMKEDEELPFEHHRVIRRAVKQAEREYLKRGNIIHVAKVTDTYWKKITQDYYNKQGFYPKQKGKTYVKSEENRADTES